MSSWLPEANASTFTVLGLILVVFFVVRFMRGLENPERVAAVFRATVLRWPVLSLLLAGAVVAVCVFRLPRFSLEASSESLVLETDPDLLAYNRTRTVFGSDEYVIVSFSREDLFTRPALEFVDKLTREFAAVPGVQNVLSITNVPLYRLTGMAALSMGQPPLTLMSPRVDIAKAREDLVTSPVWSGNLVSPDGQTNSIIVFFRVPPENIAAEKELFLLKDRIATEGREDLQAEYDAKHAAFKKLEDARKQQRRETVAGMRRVMAANGGPFYASGVPVIVIDMIEFIRGDMVMFGFGVTAFLVLVLTAIFRAWRWVVFPLLICGATVASILGVMAWLDKRVTVVTSNTASILFIVAMAHSIHFAQKYRETLLTHAHLPFRDKLAVVCGALWTPCFYTAITDSAGFGSTGICDIRPVIEFAIFMAVGVLVALALTFLVLPAGLALLPPPPDVGAREGRLHFMRRLARFTIRGRFALPALGLLGGVGAVVGMTRLEVETRFIDYFRKDTEIAKGLIFIDSQMGGTTSLEVVLDGGKKDYFTRKENLEKVERVKAYLSRVPEVGKVLTVNDMLEEGRRAIEGDGKRTVTGERVKRAAGLAAGLGRAFPGGGLVDWELAGARAASRADDRRLQPIVGLLRTRIDPSTLAGYVSPDWSQTRVFVRMRESAPTLERRRLITELQQWLATQKDMEDTRPFVTGIFLLYTNMLDSLMASQIGTFWISIVAIYFMMWALFRNWKLALLGMVPNILPILLVLGVMGWTGVHLDMVTILIASIALGIAVDATIHYTFRFEEEYRATGSYVRAIFRTHVSIGKAIFFTTTIVIVGFWILMLSNFKPTIYFGLFTGLAMIGSLFGALTIMPILLMVVKPLGKRSPPPVKPTA